MAGFYSAVDSQAPDRDWGAAIDHLKGRLALTAAAMPNMNRVLATASRPAFSSSLQDLVRGELAVNRA
jgi:hypothetical protein